MILKGKDLFLGIKLFSVAGIKRISSRGIKPKTNLLNIFITLDSDFHKFSALLTHSSHGVLHLNEILNNGNQHTKLLYI